MNITQKIKEENKLIVRGELSIGNEKAKVNFVGRLSGQYNDYFDCFFTIETDSTVYSRNTKSLTSWLVYDKSTDREYSYPMPSAISIFLKREIDKIQTELRG